MKLHSTQFEKQLRRRVKQIVRRSPELKREERRTRRPLQARLGRIHRPIFAAFLGMIVWSAMQITGHIATGVAIINLWMLALLPFLIEGLRSSLYKSTDLAALALLPISREQIFRWELQKFFRLSWLTLFDLVVCFGVLASACGFSPLKWAAAMLVAVLSWATLLAITAYCAARLPAWPFHMALAGVSVAGFAFFVSWRWTAPWMLKVIDSTAPTLNFITPTGWPATLVQTLGSDPAWWPLCLLLPIGAILWSTRVSLAELLADLQYREPAVPSVSHPMPEPARAQAAPTEVSTPGPTEIRDIITSRQFLAPTRWSERGWLEQLLWRWLSEREKSLAEFALPADYSITARWSKIVRNFGIAAAVSFVAGEIDPAFKLWLWGTGLFVVSCQLLVLILNLGPAFRPLALSGVSIPLYAGYGIGCRELSRLLLKCFYIQTPLVLTVAAASGAMTAILIGFSLSQGTTFGLRTGILLCVGRYILVGAAFGNIRHEVYWSFSSIRPLIRDLVATILAISFLGLGAGGLFAPNVSVAWWLCAGAVLDAFTLYWFFQWLFNSGRVDPLSVRQR